MPLRLLDSFVSTEPLAEVFSDEALLAAMLQFESALARAEAQAGLIPGPAASRIADAAGHLRCEPSAIARDSWKSATLAVPVIDALRARVAAIDVDAAAYVHWGATSQDLIDTALVLCLKRAAAILAADHARLQDALRRASDTHANAIMLARTLLQPATPITFGLKAASWFAAVSRAGARMFSHVDEAAVLQLGGSSGTLAALGERGAAVSASLARELGPREPDAPWHASRDRLAALVAACGVYSGTLAKIARDIALLMQEEVAEASEPGGRSSAMPHKRNPSGCAVVLAAASRVPGQVATYLAGMAQEHERGVGGWIAEAGTVCGRPAGDRRRTRGAHRRPGDAERRYRPDAGQHQQHPRCGAFRARDGAACASARSRGCRPHNRRSGPDRPAGAPRVWRRARVAARGLDSAHA